jgi:site-specific recombinase XerD
MVIQRSSLDEAIRVFEVYCRAKGLADSTLKTYSYALRCLRQYLPDEAGGPAIPARDDLRAFIAHMLASHLSRQTIRVRMRAIRVLCNFLARESLVAESPMQGVEIPRVPTVMPDVLSAGEIQRLLHAAKTPTWCGVRNHALLAMFLDTGLRLGELIALDLNDVDVARAVIRVREGKGSKERYVYAGRSLAKALRSWVEVRAFSPEEPAFFATRGGMRLDRRNVGRIVERTAQRAKLNGKRVHPHLLRHTFATHFIKNGGDPFSLQRILGHSDIKTTSIYINLAGVDLAAAHAKASPVDRLLGASAG